MTTTKLTWNRNNVTGEYHADGYVIVKVTTKSFALYQDHQVGMPGDDVGHLCRGTLAACKAEAERLVNEPPPCPVCDPTNDCDHADGVHNGHPIQINTLTNEGYDASYGETPPAEWTIFDGDHEPIDLSSPWPVHVIIEYIVEHGYGVSEMLLSVPKGIARRVRKALRRMGRGDLAAAPRMAS